MGVRVTGLRMRTATLSALGGRASNGGGAEDETMGGRVIMGLMRIVMGWV